MSEQWLGLHNPDRHFVTFEGGACHCDECGVALCLPNHPCRCCLAAEVEVLRAIRESQIEDIIALRYDLEVAREAQATIDALKAQVQRVREMHTIDQCPRCAEFHCLECGCEGVYTEQVSCRTTRVLDGGDR